MRRSRKKLFPVDLPVIRQVRIVNLEQEPGVGNGLLFLMHGVSDSVEKCLIAPVILMLHPGFYSPGGHGRQKGFASFHTLQSSLKILDVGLEGRMANKLQRACTDYLSFPQITSVGKVFWELLSIAAIDTYQ